MQQLRTKIRENIYACKKDIVDFLIPHATLTDAEKTISNNITAAGGNAHLMMEIG